MQAVDYIGEACYALKTNSKEKVMARPAKPLIDRLAQYRSINEQSGCHEWTGDLDKGGYGRLNRKGASNRAHRAAYEAFVGPIEKGKLVLHHCDNRKCINPAHLYVGDYKDNARDMIKRNRYWGRRVLSDDQVKRVLELLESGESQKAIANEIGVSQITISRINLGQRSYLGPIKMQLSLKGA